jgi:periplasmic protein TonB
MVTQLPVLKTAASAPKPAVEITLPSDAGHPELHPLPRALEADHPGSWHYDRGPHAMRNTWVALLVAAGMHGMLLFAFNTPLKEKAAIQEEEINQLIMVMPKLDELEEELELVEEPGDRETVEAADYVPMLADLPSVSLDSTFVQKLDFSSLQPRPDLDTAKVVTIPVGPRTGTRAVQGEMANLFDLRDLDTPPTPIFQPAPIFPHALKREVTRATVVVDFIVDTSGKVIRPVIYDSTHRGFEEAALAGVSRWQFRPGIKGGRRVNTRMRVPLIFTVTD